MGFFDLFKKKQNTQPTTPAERSQPTSPENHRPAAVENTTKQENTSPQPAARTADREQAELNSGLEKTKTGLFSKLARAVAGRSTIDTQVLDDLEEVLITSDVGVETTVKIIERIEARVARDKYMNTSELQSILRDEIAQLMEESHRSTENFGLDVEEGVPYVIMVVGVNGAGKTTTIGKLAAQLTRAGLNVYIGAADTFRAAAIDQLAVWAERAGATMIRQEMGSDPASVAFDTLKSAVANKADVVLIDTAGRLHNKVGLMNELTKIRNVMGKVIPNAPPEYIWHIALSMQGLTSRDPEECKALLHMLKTTDDGKGFMHEGFHKDDPSKFTRPWFAWSNSLFSEFVLKCIDENIL